MVDQTGWSRTQNVPLAGPLSPQEWQYLLGRGLVSSTLYASFRINDGVMKLSPFTNASLIGQEIVYEYMSSNWVKPSGAATRDDWKNKVSVSSDTVMYPTPLPMLYLKSRFLQSKGFDTTKEDAEFSDAFLSWSGVDKGAPIVNLSVGSRGYPLLNGWNNVPYTGYGSP